MDSGIFRGDSSKKKAENWKTKAQREKCKAWCEGK